MRTRNALVPALLLAAGPGLLAQTGFDRRTVIDNERGFYYTFPYKGRWKDIGATVMLPHRPYYADMCPEAIKIPHGHLQHFAPADPQDDFPFQLLQRYDASETAQGRPSLFVTATYQGKHRPVYWPWNLQIDASSRPRAPHDMWQQAVNLHDERFVRFFIHAYVRGRIWKQKFQNMWLGVDQCNFRYNLYGVLDDDGIFRPDIKWDAPYARSDAEFLASIRFFLRRLRELAPDIHIVGNMGSMNDESRFADTWTDMGGSICEDLCQGFDGSSYNRGHMHDFFNRYRWLGPAGKACICRLLVAPGLDYAARLRTGYLAYLVVRGDNFFFGPRLEDRADTITEIDPDEYAPLRDALGRPTGAATCEPVPDAPNPGYCLYSRPCQGGLVYLNWTGGPHTVTLPADRRWYDRTGQPITRLTIPDLAGDCALCAPGSRAARPAIHPRWPDAGPPLGDADALHGSGDPPAPIITGPLTVELETTTPGAEIRYTIDGSQPTERSPLYNGPFALTQPALVRAIAFKPGMLPSFMTAAAYDVTASPPTVEFHLASDTSDGSPGACYPLVRLSHPSATAVRVYYTGVGAASGVHGALTFPPGEVFRYFRLPVAPGGKPLRVTLSQPVGARLGARTTFALRSYERTEWKTEPDRP